MLLYYIFKLKNICKRLAHYHQGLIVSRSKKEYTIPYAKNHYQTSEKYVEVSHKLIENECYAKMTYPTPTLIFITEFCVS